MVIKSEKLLETLFDLEKSRLKEKSLRVETEALLKGLQGMSRARRKSELFTSLVETLRNVIEFEDAFILEVVEHKKMTILAATCTAVENTVWEPQSFFKRVLAGSPIASFDVGLVPEWQAQPGSVRANIASALHMGLHSAGWEAIFIITHSNIKHFGTGHVKKANRFVPLAAQALLTLELQKEIVQRDRFFELSLDLMAIIDATGRVRQHNNIWEIILGYETKEISGKQFLDFVHQDDVDSIDTILHFLNVKDGKELIEVRLQHKRGSYLWFSCSLASHNNEQLCYIVARDITDGIVFSQRLLHNAEHDSLTGLKNRESFLTHLKQEFIEASHDKEYIFAVLFLDLNKLKTINDTLGHDIGDELLKTFAKVLQQVVHGRDVVARLGGDEFTILLSEIKTARDAISVAERIVVKCMQTFYLKGHSTLISTSIGIAISTSKYSDADEMLRFADQAMYQAKLDQNLKYVVSRQYVSEERGHR
ncbi:MAG: GGDEF domain-containing protein [Desulfotalea sp.]